MTVGIERMNLYASRFSTNAVELARARGRDMDEVEKKIMARERSVLPLFEDAVTLAVNAARPLLESQDVSDIELLLVSSESSVDFSKPLSTWIHRFCGLSPNCRNFDVKHACYGGTGAFKLASSWVASEAQPGKRALVINTDFSRADAIRTGNDFIGGACAAAMIVSSKPHVLEVDLRNAGYWTNEIYDTYRPTAAREVADSEVSLFSYLDALEGAFRHYERVVGKVDYTTAFKKHIYHAPFPGMTFQAHRTLLNRFRAPRASIRPSFDQKVAPGIGWSKRIGTAYGSSNFVCLMSLLHSSEDLEPGDRISLFAYGSGCQGEFYEGRVGARARETVRAMAFDRKMDEREPLSIEQYERIELAREAFVDNPDYVPEIGELEPAYDRLYRGKKLLVLKEVKDYRRTYDWS
jgi:hydroxymethylglutaryl-CoA synthase